MICIEKCKSLEIGLVKILDTLSPALRQWHHFAVKSLCNVFLYNTCFVICNAWHNKEFEFDYDKCRDLDHLNIEMTVLPV